MKYRVLHTIGIDASQKVLLEPHVKKLSQTSSYEVKKSSVLVQKDNYCESMNKVMRVQTAES